MFTAVEGGGTIAGTKEETLIQPTDLNFILRFSLWQEDGDEIFV